MKAKNRTKLHIVGGFLGSGKTTAIIAASKYLAGQNKKVGVITNDQGRHLVDTAIMQAENLPAMEVTGGCFCCHFDGLNSRLADLVRSYDPDVIFAESVGSCADVVATVVRPLLEMELGVLRPSSYTVFADVRLLHRYLLGMEMPFSEGVNYIFGKQLEEAGLLIINKVDLISDQELKKVKFLLKEQYPLVSVTSLSALNDSQIACWIDDIQTGKYPPPVRSLEIDYDRYADAEGEMVWVDRDYLVKAGTQNMDSLVKTTIHALKKLIFENGWSDGHVKLAVAANKRITKISLAQSGEVISDAAISENLDQILSPIGEVSFLINILVSGEADIIVGKVERAIKEVCAQYHAELHENSAFERKPDYPNPTYRIND